MSAVISERVQTSPVRLWVTSLLGPFVIVYILQQEEATCELYLEVWRCGVTREVQERRRVRLDTFPTIPTMCEEKKKKKVRCIGRLRSWSGWIFARTRRSPDPARWVTFHRSQSSTARRAPSLRVKPAAGAHLLQEAFQPSRESVTSRKSLWCWGVLRCHNVT